ncbi:MAG: NAD-dependent epimerase/dehydratase, partial [Segetibacter sp.]|nr:NAD-dependent epimerase/dehydratase [Segetibacter sp.]
MSLKITVFGATGMVGKQVIKHALALGHSVKAFGRNVEDLIDDDLKTEDLVAVKGYVFDEDDVYEAVLGSHAVISTLGGAFDGKDQTRSLGIKNIITQMEKAGIKRIVALGGAGILNFDENTLLIDTPGYPDIYKPVGI